MFNRVVWNSCDMKKKVFFLTFDGIWCVTCDGQNVIISKYILKYRCKCKKPNNLVEIVIVFKLWKWKKTIKIYNIFIGSYLMRNESS